MWLPHSFLSTPLYMSVFTFLHNTSSSMRKQAFIQHSQVKYSCYFCTWSQGISALKHNGLSQCLPPFGLLVNEQMNKSHRCWSAFEIPWILHVQRIWWWRWSQLVLRLNTAKTQHGPVCYRSNWTPFPWNRPEERWVMKDRGEREKQGEAKAEEGEAKEK